MASASLLPQRGGATTDLTASAVPGVSVAMYVLQHNASLRNLFIPPAAPMVPASPPGKALSPSPSSVGRSAAASTTLRREWVLWHDKAVAPQSAAPLGAPDDDAAAFPTQLRKMATFGTSEGFYETWSQLKPALFDGGLPGGSSAADQPASSASGSLQPFMPAAAIAAPHGYNLRLFTAGVDPSLYDVMNRNGGRFTVKCIQRKRRDEVWTRLALSLINERLTDKNSLDALPDVYDTVVPSPATASPEVSHTNLMAAAEYFSSAAGGPHSLAPAKSPPAVIGAPIIPTRRVHHTVLGICLCVRPDGHDTIQVWTDGGAISTVHGPAPVAPNGQLPAAVHTSTIGAHLSMFDVLKKYVFHDSTVPVTMAYVSHSNEAAASLVCYESPSYLSLPSGSVHDLTENLEDDASGPAVVATAAAVAGTTLSLGKSLPGVPGGLPLVLPRHDMDSRLSNVQRHLCRLTPHSDAATATPSRAASVQAGVAAQSITTPPPPPLTTMVHAQPLQFLGPDDDDTGDDVDDVTALAMCKKMRGLRKKIRFVHHHLQRAPSLLSPAEAAKVKRLTEFENELRELEDEALRLGIYPTPEEVVEAAATLADRGQGADDDEEDAATLLDIRPGEPPKRLSTERKIALRKKIAQSMARHRERMDELKNPPLVPLPQVASQVPTATAAASNAAAAASSAPSAASFPLGVDTRRPQHAAPAPGPKRQQQAQQQQGTNPTVSPNAHGPRGQFPAPTLGLFNSMGGGLGCAPVHAGAPPGGRADFSVSGSTPQQPPQQTKYSAPHHRRREDTSGAPPLSLLDRNEHQQQQQHQHSGSSKRSGGGRQDDDRSRPSDDRRAEAPTAAAAVAHHPQPHVLLGQQPILFGPAGAFAPAGWPFAAGPTLLAPAGAFGGGHPVILPLNSGGGHDHNGASSATTSLPAMAPTPSFLLQDLSGSPFAPLAPTNAGSRPSSNAPSSSHHSGATRGSRGDGSSDHVHAPSAQHHLHPHQQQQQQLFAPMMLAPFGAPMGGPFFLPQSPHGGHPMAAGPMFVGHPAFGGAPGVFFSPQLAFPSGGGMQQAAAAPSHTPDDRQGNVRSNNVGQQRGGGR